MVAPGANTFSMSVRIEHSAGEMERRRTLAISLFSVLLTLIVVPTVYALVAKNTHSPEYVAQMIDKLTAAAASETKPATENS